MNYRVGKTEKRWSPFRGRYVRQRLEAQVSLVDWEFAIVSARTAGRIEAHRADIQKIIDFRSTARHARREDSRRIPKGDPDTYRTLAALYDEKVRKEIRALRKEGVRFAWKRF